jgi:hypothetical protein
MVAVLMLAAYVTAVAVPPGWQLESTVTEPMQPFSFRLSLKQDGLENLRAVASRLSLPSDKMYGQYLSLAHIKTIARPDERNVALVEDWIHNSSPCSAMSAHEIVHVTCPDVRSSEALLQTEIRPLRNSLTNQRVLHAGQVKLPTEIQNAIQCHYGLHGFPLPPRAAITVDESAPIVTPTVINAAYQVDSVVPTGSEHNRQAVAEFQGQTMNATDLTTFFQMYVPAAKANLSSDSTVSKFVGTTPATGSGGVEANLDIQYIMVSEPRSRAGRRAGRRWKASWKALEGAGGAGGAVGRLTRSTASAMSHLRSSNSSTLFPEHGSPHSPLTHPPSPPTHTSPLLLRAWRLVSRPSSGTSVAGTSAEI